MQVIRRKFANLRPSVRAIFFLLQNEFSFGLFAFCGVGTILICFLLGVSRFEFLIVILTIGGMLSIEAINTAIEELCDHVTPEQHPQIGLVKDIASGAALIMWCAAFVIGLTIFIPHIISL